MWLHPIKQRPLAIVCRRPLGPATREQFTTPAGLPSDETVPGRATANVRHAGLGPPPAPPPGQWPGAAHVHDQAPASSGLTRNHAAYSAGRNTKVSTVPTINPPMIEIAIEP